jgi:uncharacterized membrane protein
MDLIDIGLWASYLLLAIAVGASAILPLIHAIKTPAIFVKSLIAIGGLVVIFVITFAVSDSSVTQSQAAMGVSETSSRMIGAGLLMFYITLIVAIIGMVYSEFHKALK